MAVAAPAGVADESLEALELRSLHNYLHTLTAGQPGSPLHVDQLAEVPFGGLREIITVYTDSKTPFEPRTHRAFQVLLERTSRTALAPWPMVTLYSPEFAEFLTQPLDRNPLSQRLFARLLASVDERRAYDLAVRLTPEATLRYLTAGNKPATVPLLEAWNRRLARGKERRPIAGLEVLIAQISNGCTLQNPPAELEARLRFSSAWPSLETHYAEVLSASLRSSDGRIVSAGLTAQQHAPLLLDLNAAVIEKFQADPVLVEKAVQNYAFDSAHDHSETLRQIWKSLKADQGKVRFQCLIAMGAHPRGNDAVALAAVQEQPFTFMEAAIPVLKAGDPEKARQAVTHVLNNSERGHEEALRLAREMSLSGFEEQALRLAADSQAEQILRQRALLYLQLADGKVRRRLLEFLNHANADLRLAAIQMFGFKPGLTAADLEEIGPALIRVALQDPSPGHRQEAIHLLGNWREAAAVEFFQQILKANPPVAIEAGHYDDTHFWRYRLRLVGLLGLAKLNDKSAREELLELHGRGSETERMDVLLAFQDLGEVPDFTFADLSSMEPKLVATAVQLITTHGDAGERERLQEYLSRTPLWNEFEDAGIDDHNILELAGIKEHAT